MTFLRLLPLTLLGLAACVAETARPTTQTGDVVRPVAFSTPAPAQCQRQVPTGTFNYIAQPGNLAVTETRTAANPLVRVRGDGVTNETACGQQVSRTGPQGGLQFSPHNGQLPSSALQVGLQWNHGYRLTYPTGSHEVRRSCSVSGTDRYTLPGGPTIDAWVVSCTLTRVDNRQPPVTEISLYGQGNLLILQVTTNGTVNYALQSMSQTGS